MSDISRSNQFSIHVHLGLLINLLIVFSLIYAQSLGTVKKMPRPPEMLAEPPQLAIFKIGEDVQLDCRATGEPEPTYRWEFNAQLFDINGQDNRVTQQPNEGTIVFNSPMKKDEGVYQCFAYNQHGTAASQNAILVAAQLDEFQPMIAAEIHSTNVGSSLVLNCIPPKSIPIDAEITWEKFYPSSGEIHPVILSNRVSIDSYGDLYFVSIAKVDQLPRDGEYRCSVFNKYLRKSVSGMRYKIVVTGDTSLSSAPDVMWYSPDNRPVGLRGERLRLKCIFSGEPVPRIEWSRVEGEMGSEPRVVTDSFGQELIFNQVEFSDADEYLCSAFNTQAANAASRVFEVTVHSKPYWTQRPDNIETSEGETVQFVCRAGGIPKPDINWFINGKPLTLAPANPRRVITGDIVTYTNVRTQDAHVIQCNASNNYGYVFTNAYLNVIRSEPVWKVPPPPKVVFAEGQRKNLTCQTYAGPRAYVSWVKDGVYLTGGHHKVYLDGNLEIRDIVSTDAGTYVCTAENDLGQLQATSQVIVTQPTKIVTKPEDLMVTAGKEAKFICTATTDPSLFYQLRIQWLKYSNVINAKQSGRVFQNLRDNSLTITDVNDQDAALYTCRAITNLDSSEAKAFLRVRNVPNPPEITQVKCMTNRTATNKLAYFATVYFTARGSNYAPINKFNVEYSTDFASDAWSVIHSTDSTNPTEIRLSPYGNYTFRIVAFNFIGQSEPSHASKEICRTEADSPTVQPRNVRAEGFTSNNMVISWTPVLPINHNGDGFKYLVEWNCTEIDCQYDPKTRGQATIVDYNINRYVVENQPSYHRYDVKVSCRNEIGESTEIAVRIVGYSGEFKPTKSPDHVEVIHDSVGSSSATLKWRAVEDTVSNIGGFFVGYVIRFYRREEGFGRVRYELIQLNDPEKRFTKNARGSQRRGKRSPADYGLPNECLHASSRSKRDTEVVRRNEREVVVTIHSLPPNSEVELSVAIFNTRYYGPFSSPITIRTKEGPPGPVDHFAVLWRNANTVRVEWSAPSDPNGEVVGYEFAHREITGLNLGDRTWDHPLPNPSQRRHNITGLRPDQMYRIYIYAMTSAGRGDENFLDVRTTGAGAPEPPTFDVVNIVNTSMNVSWMPASTGNPGGAFYVQYKMIGKTVWLVSPMETDNHWIVLLHLSSGTEYAVRVVSQNGFAQEAASDEKYYTTTGATPSLSYVVGEAWFILMVLSFFFLIALLLVLIFCKEKLQRKYNQAQGLEYMNGGEDRQHYHSGGHNVAFSKSGESLYVHAADCHLPEYEQHQLMFWPEMHNHDPPRRFHDRESEKPHQPDLFVSEESIVDAKERRSPYGMEENALDVPYTTVFAPHEEPAPLMFLPPVFAPREEPAPIMFLPHAAVPTRHLLPRQNTRVDPDVIAHSTSTSV